MENQAKVWLSKQRSEPAVSMEASQKLGPEGQAAALYHAGQQKRDWKWGTSRAGPGAPMQMQEQQRREEGHLPQPRKDHSHGTLHVLAPSWEHHWCGWMRAVHCTPSICAVRGTSQGPG